MKKLFTTLLDQSALTKEHCKTYNDVNRTCEYMFDCCDCGGFECDCRGCWSCNACDYCKDEGIGIE